MADFYSFFFFFCKLQPRENNLNIQLICVHAEKVSLISFSTVQSQNFDFVSPTHLGLSEWHASWSSPIYPSPCCCSPSRSRGRPCSQPLLWSLAFHLMLPRTLIRGL